ncbi:hypothetical protein H0H93_014873 [Arthromyces matolae]|nr:hypothetical protein H0H93_014873 [Arthromyces matolae]
MYKQPLNRASIRRPAHHPVLAFFDTVRFLEIVPYSSSQVMDYLDGLHKELRQPDIAIDLVDPDNLFMIYDFAVLNARATYHSGTIIRIMSKSLSWEIVIKPDATVGDVLSTIIDNLQEPKTQAFAKLKVDDYQRFLEVDQRRRDRGGVWAIGLDWLPDNERTFIGLSSEKSVANGTTVRILKVND